MILLNSPVEVVEKMEKKDLITGIIMMFAGFLFMGFLLVSNPLDAQENAAYNGSGISTHLIIIFSVMAVTFVIGLVIHIIQSFKDKNKRKK